MLKFFIWYTTDNHKSVLISFGIETSNNELDLLYINLESEDAQKFI